MQRRDFFKRLLQATAGATIAYSFPSVIVPKNLAEIPAISNVGVLTFAKLNAAYDKIKNQMGCEPDVMILNKVTYEYMMTNVINPQLRFSVESNDPSIYFENVKFMGSRIEPSDTLEEGLIAGSYGLVGVRDGIIFRDMSCKIKL